MNRHLSKVPRKVEFLERSYPMTKPQFIDFNTKTPNPNFNGVLDIAPDELRTKKSEVKIVDVRRPDEWMGEFGHIPGAQLVTLDTLSDHIEDFPKDKTIVFVCRSGGRSAQATAIAQANGYTNVFNMQGGMMAWTAKNFETEGRNVP